jgi:hypothetical protein
VAVTVVNVGLLPELPESTSNCSVFDVPPPGLGDCTVIAVIPEDAIALAGTTAVSCVAFT